MALNMKTLGTRALSALVFVLLLLGCLLWNYYSFTIFFFCVALMGLNEFYRLSEKLNAKPYKLIGFICGALIYISFVCMTSIPIRPKYLLTIFPLVILITALFSKRENPLQNAVYTMLGVVYSILPFGILHFIVISENAEGIFNFQPYPLLGVILLIWGNDTFAYLGGSLFGKHKMIERISPGKTWEGTIFGILFTFILNFLVGKYLLNGTTLFWTVLGFIVPVFATLGDLVESMIKREANIKDTGSIMPGHGGILDRFDSLIFVTPFVFVIMKLL